LARIVLLADDSVTAQNMGRRILMDAGYEVITVNNGSAALKKIHESKPDLIVLDVYMPGYGGLEVCQRLKESVETQKIPVLLTVGKMEPFKTDEAKRVKADAHIVKPFDAGELLAALTKLEDRIVPSSDGRGKSKPKKTRMWHSEDPAKNFDDSNTDQIAYLAEVKKRQAESAPTEQQPAEAVASPSVSEMPAAAFESVSSAPEVPLSAQDDQPEVSLASATVEAPSVPDIPAPEFSVEQTSSADYQAEPAAPPDAYAPIQPDIADAVSVAQPDVTAPPETKSRWVAETVALSAEEASLELEREMQTAQAVVSTSTPPEAVAEPSSIEPTPSSEAATEQPSPEAAGSAFAATAAAGASSVGASAPISANEPPVASEAVAAWENWQHIRDSVMTPQTTAALAESVVEITQATAPAFSEPTANSESEIGTQSQAPETSSTSVTQGSESNVAQEAAQSSSPDSSALEGEALASIVDSVLAELKPKLMQEIARKLKK